MSEDLDPITSLSEAREFLFHRMNDLQNKRFTESEARKVSLDLIRTLSALAELLDNSCLLVDDLLEDEIDEEEIASDLRDILVDTVKRSLGHG